MNLIKKMLKNKLFLSFLFSFILFLFIFQIANAQGLVPCGNGSSRANACTLCHLIVGFYNIFTWFRTILITVAAVGIFISGVMYIISSGNEGAVTKAKGFLQASIIGFIVVISAWFIVNVTMWIISADPESITDPNATTIERKAWNRFECSTNTTTSINTNASTSTNTSATTSASAGSLQSFISTLPTSPVIPQGLPNIPT